jgi:hypothetical protein
VLTVASWFVWSAGAVRIREKGTAYLLPQLRFSFLFLFELLKEASHFQLIVEIFAPSTKSQLTRKRANRQKETIIHTLNTGPVGRLPCAHGARPGTCPSQKARRVEKQVPAGKLVIMTSTSAGKWPLYYPIALAS